MVADLVNARGGAKMYTIKGMFGLNAYTRMARIMTRLSYRRSGIHQRGTDDRFGVQPGFPSVSFPVAASAIRVATSKGYPRAVYFPWVGDSGGARGRFIDCRARPTFTDVVLTNIGCCTAITSGELHGCSQGGEKGILTSRVGWAANAQVSRPVT